MRYSLYTSEQAYGCTSGRREWGGVDTRNPAAVLPLRNGLETRGAGDVLENRQDAQPREDADDGAGEDDESQKEFDNRANQHDAFPFKGCTSDKLRERRAAPRLEDPDVDYADRLQNRKDSRDERKKNRNYRQKVKHEGSSIVFPPPRSIAEFSRGSIPNFPDCPKTYSLAGMTLHAARPRHNPEALWPHHFDRRRGPRR